MQEFIANYVIAIIIGRKLIFMIYSHLTQFNFKFIIRIVEIHIIELNFDSYYYWFLKFMLINLIRLKVYFLIILLLMIIAIIQGYLKYFCFILILFYYIPINPTIVSNMERSLSIITIIISFKFNMIRAIILGVYFIDKLFKMILTA